MRAMLGLQDVRPHEAIRRVPYKMSSVMCTEAQDHTTFCVSKNLESTTNKYE